MKLFNKDISLFNPFKSNSVTAKVSEGKSRTQGENKDIMMKVVSSFKDRSRKDIQRWRSALQLAENPEKPDRTALHDLYYDLLTDGHLIAQMRLRKYATLNTEFQIKNRNTGKINEEATNFFNQKWFYDFLTSSVDSIFFGTTLVYFREFATNKVDVKEVPRQNVVPELKIVIPDLKQKNEFFRYDDDEYLNWVLQIGGDTDFGLLNTIIPNLIWKRNVAQSWAEWCEKFGQPLITAETNQTDTKIIDHIEELLTQLGEASQAVLPKGTTIDIKQPSQTDAYQVYQEFHRVNNDEMAEAIIGGTMITKDGSSRSQSEVHERNLDKKIAVADKRNICFLVNDDLIPLLMNQGYSFLSEGDQLVFNKSHDIPLDKYWTIVNGVSADYEIDPEFITKTFGIPIKGKKKSPTPKPNIVAKLKNFNLPNYPDDDCCGTFTAAGDRFEKTIKDYTEALLQQLWNNESTLSSEARIMAAEGQSFLESLFTGWGDRRTKAAWNTPDHLALSMMELNVFEFSASKTEARLAAMSELLIDKEKLQIRNFSDFVNEARKVNDDFNIHYLRTERNIAISVGQNSANYIRLKAEQNVMPFVEYQTSGDSKVRPEHQILDGKVFNLNDPNIASLNPPNGYNCRCELVQLASKPADYKIIKAEKGISLLGEKFKNSEWDVNRADVKQVFLKKQFYGDVPYKKMEKFNYKNAYGLKDWSSFKENLKPLQLDKSITVKNVTELFLKETLRNRTVMPFRDYLKRSIILPEENFNKHIKGKYLKQNRHQIFPKIKNILNNPDEVWLIKTNRKNAQMRYVKFYKDDVIIIESIVGDLSFEIKTWYKMQVSEEKIRNGILIHKNEKLD